MERLYAAFLLISLFMKGFTQNIPVKHDSLKTYITTATLLVQTDSINQHSENGNITPVTEEKLQ